MRHCFSYDTGYNIIHYCASYAMISTIGSMAIFYVIVGGDMVSLESSNVIVAIVGS